MSRINKAFFLMIGLLTGCIMAEQADSLEIPGKGAFQQVSFDTRTWEGDHSSLTLNADGKIITNGKGHSGYGGEYGDGRHEYGPVPRKKVARIVKLLSRPGSLVEKAQEAKNTSKSERITRTVVTADGSYDLIDLDPGGKLMLAAHGPVEQAVIDLYEKYKR